MNLISSKSRHISGELFCPGDKSISQRILIIGSILNADIEINGFLDAHDPNSTLNALNDIGSSIEKIDKKIIITKRKVPFCDPSKNLDLGNSGTGVRLMLGLISGLGINARFVGDSSLMKRPMRRVIDPLMEMGAKNFSDNGTLPIDSIRSKIRNDFSYKMPIASAQVKSCLLLAALSSKTNISLQEPKITRDHTERMIQYFGGNIEYGTDKKIVYEYSELSSRSSYQVVGDFSSASFIIAASLISENSKVLLKNVGLNTTRSALLDLLKRMGAKIEVINKQTTCNELIGDLIIQSSKLQGINVPEDIIPNIIDEIPILSIIAAFADGQTIIKNASELKVKESDRLFAISDGLNKLKINHETYDDGLLIFGGNQSIDCDDWIDSFDDHRIAMSFLIAGLKSKNGIKVKNCKNIDTSFPDFRNIMNKLGMKLSEKN